MGDIFGVCVGNSYCKLLGSFPFVPPPPVRYATPPPPVTEHVSLHGISLCKNIARASGGANNMRPLSWKAQTEKIRLLYK